MCPIWTLLQSQRGCVIRHYKATYAINCDTLNHLQPLLKFARPRFTLVCVRRLEQEVLPDGGVSPACHQMSFENHVEFPVDGRSCLYPMIDGCSRALTNMEGLFVHSGQTQIFANIPRWKTRLVIHDRHEQVKLMLETCRAATRGASATPATIHVRSFVWQSRWQSRPRSI